MIMKLRNFMFMVASLIIFSTLSAISFVLASGNYNAEFIFIFCLASFLFLISLLGTFFSKKIYDLFMRFGNKILTWSVYYDEMSIEAKQGYKTFSMISKIFAVLSNILLIVLLVLVLL